MYEMQIHGCKMLRDFLHSTRVLALHHAECFTEVILIQQCASCSADAYFSLQPGASKHTLPEHTVYLCQ